MIVSTGNSRIRELAKLKKNAKYRAERNVFLVEGPKMFREIPETLVQEVYVSESFLKSAEGRALPRKYAGNPHILFETAADAVFQHLSDTRTPQGILAVVRQLHYRAEDLLRAAGASDAGHNLKDPSDPPLLAVLENLQDPGNLGTIVRTAEAAGATGILLSADCADIYNPKVTRSTMGSIFRVPFVYTPHLHEELVRLKAAGVKLFAAHLSGSSDMYTESYDGPCAFLIGNESRGLRDETAALADRAVRIPMSGRVESLNAAVATSVLLYEARRQRNASAFF